MTVAVVAVCAEDRGERAKTVKKNRMPTARKIPTFLIETPHFFELKMSSQAAS
jgi:hypothetical protein